jgi:hypothetical protein
MVFLTEKGGFQCRLCLTLQITLLYLQIEEANMKVFWGVVNEEDHQSGYKIQQKKLKTN